MAHALKFIAHKLVSKDLGEQLAGPIVSIGARGKVAWETLPLPLFVVCQLEQAASSGPLEDRFLVGCFLLMVWCSLRFLDIQRVDLTYVQTLDATIRGWVWRSKTSPVTGLNWGREFGASLADLRKAFPKRDFLLSDSARPLQYSCALAQCRCLCECTCLGREDVFKYSLRSLKATCLSRDAQLQISPENRAAPGHHRLRSSSGCVEKRCRDDVPGALRCQREILRQVAKWTPFTTLQRGVAPVKEQPLPLRAGGLDRASDTEGESAEEAAADKLAMERTTQA